MPALPNVPKVIRVVSETTDGADLHAINRWFLQYSGSAPTSAQLATLCGVADAAWDTNLKALFGVNTTHIGTTMEDLTSATSAVASSVDSTAGTRAGGALAAGTAAVLSYAIARRYRGGHPRSYLAAGVTGDLNTRQTWTGGFTAALQAGWVAYVAGIASSPWAGGGSLIQVNVSYYQGFTPFKYPSGRYRNIPTLRVGGPVVDVVTGVTSSPKIASQRRRNLQST